MESISYSPSSAKRGASPSSTSMLKYERLLMTSPTYRAAPPVRRVDEGYDTALAKWKELYGGDESKLVIERDDTAAANTTKHSSLNTSLLRGSQRRPKESATAPSPIHAASPTAHVDSSLGGDGWPTMAGSVATNKPQTPTGGGTAAAKDSLDASGANQLASPAPPAGATPSRHGLPLHPLNTSLTNAGSPNTNITSPPRTAADFIAAAQRQRQAGTSPKPTLLPQPTATENNTHANTPTATNHNAGNPVNHQFRSVSNAQLYPPITGLVKRADSISSQQPMGVVGGGIVHRQQSSSAAAAMNTSVGTTTHLRPHHSDPYGRLASAGVDSTYEGQKALMRPPPPPPQRPYTVEWIVTTPQHTRYNHETGTYEAASVTPIPDPTVSRSQPTPISPVAATPSAAAAAGGGGRYNDHSKHMPPSALSNDGRSFMSTNYDYEAEHDDRDDQLAADTAALLEDVSADRAAVGVILLMLEELDARKGIKARRRQELAKLHRTYTGEAIATGERIENAELTKAAMVAFEQQQRAHQTEEQRRRYERHLRHLEQLQRAEEQHRASIVGEERSHINAIFTMAARNAPVDLMAAQAAQKALLGVEEREGEQRVVVARAESDERHSILSLMPLSELNAQERAAIRIEARLAWIRSGDPIQQRKDEEDEEAAHRQADVIDPEAQEWAIMLATFVSARPMILEDVRRMSLTGLLDELVDDSRRFDSGAEELADDDEDGSSSVSSGPPSSSNSPRRKVDDDDMAMEEDEPQPRSGSQHLGGQQEGRADSLLAPSAPRPDGYDPYASPYAQQQGGYPQHMPSEHSPNPYGFPTFPGQGPSPYAHQRSTSPNPNPLAAHNPHSTSKATADECRQYLDEMYQSHAQRAKQAHYGYNRNGWRYTPERPDPLKFAGVRDSNGKLLGAASPTVKEAMRALITPNSRAAQRGDSTFGRKASVATTTSLPPGTIILPTASEPPVEQIIPADAEAEMLNILKNIKRSKQFSWPRHHASVRDRPSFPQDAECDIYRREPGPNMGTSKRYHDEIDDAYAEELKAEQQRQAAKALEDAKARVEEEARWRRQFRAQYGGGGGTESVGRTSTTRSDTTATTMLASQSYHRPQSHTDASMSAASQRPMTASVASVPMTANSRATSFAYGQPPLSAASASRPISAAAFAAAATSQHSAYGSSMPYGVAADGSSARALSGKSAISASVRTEWDLI